MVTALELLEQVGEEGEEYLDALCGGAGAAREVHDHGAAGSVHGVDHAGHAPAERRVRGARRPAGAQHFRHAGKGAVEDAADPSRAWWRFDPRRLFEALAGPA